MEKLKVAAFTGLWVCLLYSQAGCSNTHAEKKQAMETHWEQSSAVAQIPVIENMIEQGRVSEAKKEINKCLEAFPDSAHVHFLAGRVQVMDQDYDKAKWAFLKAIELDPQMATAWHSLGSVAVLEKDTGHALDCYFQACRLDPQNADHVLSLSEIYIETGQMEQAGQVLKDGLVKQPRSLELTLALAALERQMGQYDDAGALYEQALVLHGARAEILEPCAYFYVARGQWQKAAERFEQLLGRYSPDSEHYTPALRALAMCQFNAGRYAESLKHWDRLSAICRDDADVWLYMAQSALGLDDAPLAAASAQKSLQIKPGQAAAYAVLGSAQYMQGYSHDAIVSFDRITDNPDVAAYAWFMTGRCYQRLGQTIQANTAFEKAEELNPDGKLVRTFLKRSMQPL